MNFQNELLEEIIAFRKELHQSPELSGKEHKTTAKIIKFIEKSKPDEIITFMGIGGLAAVFKGKDQGKTVLLRADIDALPIKETNSFAHKSKYPGIGHKCGHDGHTAILAGFSRLLQINPVTKGTAVLLFQPAEETGAGAQQVINHASFSRIVPDYAFALHNLPGFPLNTMLIKNDCFASASKGLIIKLFGQTVHAAFPEKGLNPALAMAEIITRLSKISQSTAEFKDYVLLTIIHSKLGKRTFGTSPGDAVVMATLRSYRNDDMETLTNLSREIVLDVCDKHELAVKISWTDQFPATINHNTCIKIVKEVADLNGFAVQQPNKPFRWSEDFGHFTQKFPGAMFGIGAGENIPDLHHPEYDFRDEILVSGIKMFDGIVRKVLS